MERSTLLKDETGIKCDICNTAISEPLNLGNKYYIKDLVVHYYCVLLSHKISQNGEDEEGVQGFLYSDIKKCISRSETRSCHYCRGLGASIQCDKCKIEFHLPCGVVNKAVSVFKGDFKSFCSNHRPRQIIPPPIIQEAKMNSPLCLICMEYINVLDLFNILWAPCCQKTWFHRGCIQKWALSQAALFKCVICSDVNKFSSSMTKLGVFIPSRDASWELEPNAFRSLLERYSRCDTEECMCPYGRTGNRRDTIWEIIICVSCGSKGTHIRCSQLEVYVDWECLDCAKVLCVTEATSPSA